MAPKSHTNVTQVWVRFGLGTIERAATSKPVDEPPMMPSAKQFPGGQEGLLVVHRDRFVQERDFSDIRHKVFPDPFHQP